MSAARLRLAGILLLVAFAIWVALHAIPGDKQAIDGNDDKPSTSH